MDNAVRELVRALEVLLKRTGSGEGADADQIARALLAVLKTANLAKQQAGSVDASEVLVHALSEAYGELVRAGLVVGTEAYRDYGEPPAASSSTEEMPRSGKRSSEDAEASRVARPAHSSLEDNVGVSPGGGSDETASAPDAIDQQAGGEHHVQPPSDHSDAPTSAHSTTSTTSRDRSGQRGQMNHELNHSDPGVCHSFEEFLDSRIRQDDSENGAIREIAQVEFYGSHYERLEKSLTPGAYAEYESGGRGVLHRIVSERAEDAGEELAREFMKSFPEKVVPYRPE